MTPEQTSPSREKSKSSRITVVDQTYCQRVGKQPQTFPSRYCRDITSEEQVYCRTTKISCTWKRVDTGWVETPQMMIITNESTNKESSIEITFGVQSAPTLLVRSGESQKLLLCHNTRVYIRCSNSEDCPCTIVAVPE